jgi:hypothetical protein
MIKCICGKDFDSERGFKIHSKRMGEGHSQESIVVNNSDTTTMDNYKEAVIMTPIEAEKVVESNKIDVLDPKKTIADVVIPRTGEVVISYDFERHGERFAEYAMGMARKKGLEVRFR